MSVFRQQKSLDDNLSKNHVIFGCEECEKEFKYDAVLKNTEKQCMKTQNCTAITLIMTENVPLMTSVYIFMKNRINLY